MDGAEHPVARNEFRWYRGSEGLKMRKDGLSGKGGALVLREHKQVVPTISTCSGRGVLMTQVSP